MNWLFRLFTIAFFITLFSLFSNNASADNIRYKCSDGTASYNSMAECEERCESPASCVSTTDNTPSGSTVSLPDPLGGTKNSPTTIPTLLGKIIQSVLGVVGSLALVMFIYGGITWMLSAGNQEQVTKGKNILIWATLGMVVIFTAYALVKFVIGAVAGP